MKSIQKPVAQAGRFTIADKSRAFFSGLLSGKPLVEVACAGLSAGADEKSMVGYARRIKRAGDSDAACRALRGGIRCEEAECILASAIDNADHAFAMLVGQRLVSEAAEVIVAKKLAAAKTASECYMLLKLQTVRSHEAQEILAQAVHAGRLSERAVELLASGSTASPEAQKKLTGIVPEDGKTIMTIFIRGKLAHDAMRELSRKIPPICVPCE